MSSLAAGFNVAAQAAGEALPPLQGVATAFAKLGEALTQTTTQITGSFLNALKAIKDAFAAILQPLSGVLQPIQAMGNAIASLASSALEPFMGIINKISAAGTALGQTKVGEYLKGVVGAVGGALEGMGSALGAVGAGAGAVLGTVMQLGQAMAQFVALADPGTFQLFQRAMNDMMAVIGQGLSPILQVVTTVIRMAADSLSSWLPALGAVAASVLGSLLPAFQVLYDVYGRIGQAIVAVTQAAAPGLMALGAAIGSIFQAFQPILNLFVEILGGIAVGVVSLLVKVIQAAVPVAMALAMAMKEVFEWVSSMVKNVLAMLGIALPEFKTFEQGKSTGAAVSQAQTISVGSVLQKAQVSAFSAGRGGPAEDPMKIAADATKALDEKAREIYDLIRSLPEDISGFFEMHLTNLWSDIQTLSDTMWENVQTLPTSVWNLIQNMPDQIADALKKVLTYGTSLNPFDKDKTEGTV